MDRACRRLTFQVPPLPELPVPQLHCELLGGWGHGLADLWLPEMCLELPTLKGPLWCFEKTASQVPASPAPHLINSPAPKVLMGNTGLIHPPMVLFTFKWCFLVL